MLIVRGANLMALATAVPCTAERAGKRCPSISRFIDNQHVICDEVMAPFAVGMTAAKDRHLPDGRSVLWHARPDWVGTDQGLRLSAAY